MMIEKINNLIKQEQRNIIFYFDEDGSVREDIPSIEESGIKVIEVNDNYFELKYKIEYELKAEKLFLYHAYKKPEKKDLKKYPLLDLLIANVELRLDDAYEFMSEYKLGESNLDLIKKYIKQLKTKANRKKLARILSRDRFNESSLQQGLISIMLGFNTVADKNSCMAKCLIIANDGTEFEKLLKNLKALELDSELLKWFNELLDTHALSLDENSIKEFAEKIKYNVITIYLDKTLADDHYAKLKLDRVADINMLQVFFQDWSNNASLKESIDSVFLELAKDIKTSKITSVYGLQQEYGYYSEQIIEAIVEELYKEVIDNPSKTKDDSIKWMRLPVLSDEYKNQLEFIYRTASVFTVLEAYKAFVFKDEVGFINEYTQELYKVDYNFRKAVMAFDKVKDYLFGFDAIGNELFDKLNRIYDRFLIDLNVEWQKVLNKNKFDYRKINVNKQYEFYEDNIAKLDHKIVVIISDALRYEVGMELFEKLLADSKNNLEITPSLASVPSYTNLGMSNLLPNSGIEVETSDNDLVFKIDGKTTVSSNREAILQAKEKESATIDFNSVMKFGRDDGRDFFKANKIIYIYHDWIDAIGDKKGTEGQSFEAGEKAIADIQRLIKKLYGWNMRHVIITSDHGFLYNYTELAENSREKLPKTIGYERSHIRFVVADDFEGKVDGLVLNLDSTTNINTKLKVAIPRAINRYRKQGNVGVQFVHGGAGIQELITPVIKFYKKKVENNNYVTFKRFDQTDKILSGSIRIKLLQDVPVTNEYKSLEVIFGLYSENGALLSQEVELHFNSTSSNPKERIFDVILSLNAKGSKSSFCYLRAYDKKDKNRLNTLGINDLIKIVSKYERDDF